MATCQWQCGRFTLDLSAPKIMGIVNITPDSFSDGGTYSASVQTALAHAEALLESGADILDIGGESTRPGAAAVSAQEEWARVQPVLEELVKWQVPISLDTRRTAVMQQALAHGYADIINDVAALGDEGAIGLLAQQAHTGICLMHMQGMPETMQQSPSYQDVAGEVLRYLNERVAACEAAGIARARLVLDPGFGFGKTTAHNLQLLAQLERFVELGVPVLAGLSRKRSIGELTGRDVPADRVAGSVAAHLIAAQRGAAIVRVHDVAATVDALKVWNAVAAVQTPRKAAATPAIRWPDDD